MPSPRNHLSIHTRPLGASNLWVYPAISIPPQYVLVGRRFYARIGLMPRFLSRIVCTRISMANPYKFSGMTSELLFFLPLDLPTLRSVLFPFYPRKFGHLSPR